jgi:hypothetical protein
MDAVADAIAELYAAHPDTFIARRKELAAAARTGGDTAAARAIGELRRPTRSAWVVNAFVRSDPDALQPLLELGAELREAHRRLDGNRLRELSAKRRRVIDEAVYRATQVCGPQSESVRAEMVATLEAAVSDPASAAEVSEAALVRPLEWSGFGDPGPALSVVPSAPKPSRPLRPVSAVATDAEAEEEALRRRRAIAQSEAAAADDQVGEADTRIEAAAGRVQALERDLAAARAELKAANAERRAAVLRQQAAQRRLHRLGG